MQKSMKATPIAVSDVLILEPKVFGDSRCLFYESFNEEAFNEATRTNYQFVHDNHSRSAKGVLRGLHCQIQQHQGKLVRVVRGAMFDVAVNIRNSSPSFEKCVGLSSARKTTGSCGCRRGLPMDSLYSASARIFCTKLLTIIRRTMSDVLRGMVR